MIKDGHTGPEKGGTGKGRRKMKKSVGVVGLIAILGVLITVPASAVQPSKGAGERKIRAMGPLPNQVHDKVSPKIQETPPSTPITTKPSNATAGTLTPESAPKPPIQTASIAQVGVTSKPSAHPQGTVTAPQTPSPMQSDTRPETSGQTSPSTHSDQGKLPEQRTATDKDDRTDKARMMPVEGAKAARDDAAIKNVKKASPQWVKVKVIEVTYWRVPVQAKRVPQPAQTTKHYHPHKIARR